MTTRTKVLSVTLDDCEIQINLSMEVAKVLSMFGAESRLREPLVSAVFPVVERQGNQALLLALAAANNRLAVLEDQKSANESEAADDIDAYETRVQWRALRSDGTEIGTYLTENMARQWGDLDDSVTVVRRTLRYGPWENA